MSLYDEASLIAYPSGYKESKIYTQKPVASYGAELVTNGDFVTDTDWTKGTGWTISGGKAVANTSGNYNNLTQSNVFVVGKTYITSFEITDVTQGSVRLSQAGVDISGFQSSLGVYTVTYTAVSTGSGDELSMQGFNSFVGSIDNVSVKEVLVAPADLTFTRASSATRVNAEGLIETASILSPTEIVVNGDFATGGNWNGQNSIANNQLTKTSTGLVYQGTLSVSVQSYLVVVNVDTYAAGLTIYLGGTQVALSQGVNTINMQSGGSNTFIGFNNGNGAVINSISVKQYITSNIPRIDYSNGCGSLLLEPQRTNEFKYSNDFANAIWVKTSTTITSDEIASPIYGEMADSILATATTAQHRVLQTPATNGVGAFTMYIKQKELSRIVIHLLGVNKGRGFDCSDNTTFAAIGVAADAAYYNISDFGNGWSKIEVYDGSGATTRVDVYLASPVVGANNSVWTGDGTSKMYISAAQFEQGSYPTSYIPSSGTTVTRIQDTSSTTGLSSVVGQTEGTLFVEMASLSNLVTSNYLSISDGSYNNRLSILFSTGTNVIRAFLRLGGSVQCDLDTTAYDITQMNKIAFKYKANDFALWVNGTEVDIDSSGSTFSGSTLTTFAFNEIGTGTGALNGKCQNLMVFPSALTDEELIDLTGSKHTSFNSLATFYNYTIL